MTPLRVRPASRCRYSGLNKERICSSTRTNVPRTLRALDAVTVLTSTGRSLDDVLWINLARLNDGDRVHDDGDHSVTSRNRDFRLVDFGRGGFGLAHGALRMNAAT
jgi:hypothetical protein